MKLKLVISALIAAVMLAVAPAWAHGGHGHGQWKHWKHHPRHYVHYGYVPYVYHDRVIVREYVAPVPVYRAYPAPAPGIHVVAPSIYIPFR